MAEHPACRIEAVRAESVDWRRLRLSFRPTVHHHFSNDRRPPIVTVARSAARKSGSRAACAAHISGAIAATTSPARSAHRAPRSSRHRDDRQRQHLCDRLRTIARDNATTRSRSACGGAPPRLSWPRRRSTTRPIATAAMRSSRTAERLRRRVTRASAGRSDTVDRTVPRAATHPCGARRSRAGTARSPTTQSCVASSLSIARARHRRDSSRRAARAGTGR